MPDIDFDFSGKKPSGCIPVFHYEQRVDQEQSDEAGHPVFKDIEYVKIITPGNDKEVVNRAVKKEDMDRWPDQYRAFKNNEKIEFEGTPIKEWPQVTAAQAKTLGAMHVYTVEQLAEMADQNVNGMGMLDLKNRAKAWIEWQSGEASVQKYAQQNRRLNERIEQLEEQLAALLKSKDEVAPEVAPEKTPRKKKGSAK